MEAHMTTDNPADQLPQCPRYVAHPQAVWFEEHWRPIIDTLRAENIKLKEQVSTYAVFAEELQAHADKLAEAMEWISDETKRDHREPDLYTKYGCVIHRATEAISAYRTSLQSKAQGVYDQVDE